MKFKAHFKSSLQRIQRTQRVGCVAGYRQGVSFVTVKELINVLQNFSDDLPIIVSGSEVENVYLNEEHYFGDTANPNCKVGSAVEIV